MTADLESVLRKARRLGHDDPEVVVFAMAVRVSEVLEGPPLWGMLVGPASGGKTEIITVCGDGTYEMGDVTLPGLLSFRKVGKAGREKFIPVGALTRIGPKVDRDKGVYRGAITIPEFSGVLADSNVGKCDRLYAFMRMTHDGRAPRDLGQVEEQLWWEGTSRSSRAARARSTATGRTPRS
jgi:hypothetical protein